MLEVENAGKADLLKSGYSLRAPELLFRKIEDSEIEMQIEKLKSGSTETKRHQSFRRHELYTGNDQLHGDEEDGGGDEIS